MRVATLQHHVAAPRCIVAAARCNVAAARCNVATVAAPARARAPCARPPPPPRASPAQRAPAQKTNRTTDRAHHVAQMPHEAACCYARVRKPAALVKPGGALTRHSRSHLLRADVARLDSGQHARAVLVERRVQLGKQVVERVDARDHLRCDGRPTAMRCVATSCCPVALRCNGANSGATGCAPLQQEARRRRSLRSSAATGCAIKML